MTRALTISIAVLMLMAAVVQASEDSLYFGRFGLVHIYYDSPRPAKVVLFVSGDGGWNLGVVDMARSLASHDAMVVGIDITHLLGELNKSNDKCSYPAGDFEELSKFIQKKYEYPEYTPPVLVGYSSGATLVYALLAQAPFNTFKGGMSLGFCPDLPVAKTFCYGIGLEWIKNPNKKGYSFLPAENLEVPWIALQGDIDQVCDPESTRSFVARVKNASLLELPKVGHGFSVERNWMPQFMEGFAQIASAKIESPPPAENPEVKDLPLVEVGASGPHRNILAIHVTGDGGWGVTDRGIAQSLSDHGISVIGINSLKYFWRERTPDESGRDLQRVLRHYLTAWKKDKIVLIGYSMGADVLPFMINRLSDDLRARIELVALIGPSEKIDFKFHLTNWIGGSQSKSAYPTVPKIEKLRGLKILCFYGQEDEEAVCPDLDSALVHALPLEGGHLVKSRFDSIVHEILNNID